MAESPTAWWCPTCGYVMDWTIADGDAFGHWSEDGDVAVWHPMIQVPVIPPGLSLLQLAVALKAVGFAVGEISGPAGGDHLVVGAKEKTP